MRLKHPGLILSAALIALSPLSLQAQATFKPPPITKANEDYVKPFPPLHIVGNLYYVGTYDLAVYLIVTPAGNILINTGVNDSVAPIRANIEKLGFKVSDIKLLLATHGHWDHVAGMAELKRLTGAKMLMQEADAGMLEDGGRSDYRFPQGREPAYEPVKVDQRLKDGDKVKLGDTELTVMHHPGHTKGATSFSFTTQDAGRTYRVLIANMGSINPGVKVSGMPAFPGITDAYAQTFAKQKQIVPEVWVASHAKQFGLHEKYQPGDAYDPNRFVDPEGYRKAVAKLEKIYLDQLAQERAEQAK
jgi:metallo-beta-lactamase class B